MEKTKTTKFLGSFSLSKNGGGAGGTTNYDDLANKPKVNGIILSGNKTSADLGITTLTPFPSTWPTTGKFEDLLAAIRVDTIAVKGASFLGEVTFDDLPANLGNAEIKIEILEGTTSATKVIHSVITSGNREPYRWEYTSWNSGNSNSGWISFQLPLTAGDGISIENNVISTTGGNVYTQSNLLGGKSIEIVEEPVEGGIDNHTLACWHFDNSLLDEVSQLSIRNTDTATFATGKFGMAVGDLYGGRPESNFLLTNVLDVLNDWTVDCYVVIGSYQENDGLTLRVGGEYSGSQLSAGYTPFKGSCSLYKYGTQLINTTVEKISVGEKPHFAFQKKGNNAQIFINGKKVIDYDLSSYTLSSSKGFQTFGGSYTRIDELRISDIARYPGDFFELPTKAYSVAVPTGNKVINNTGVTSINTKSGNVTLTADDINVTYTHEGAETTTTIKEFADTVDHNIENLNSLIPVNAYTAENLIAGKNITIEEVLPEGGIDNHTKGCWHFDGNNENAVDGSVMASSSTGFDTNGHFGSCAKTPTFTGWMPTPSDDYTWDFWFKTSTITGYGNGQVGGIGNYSGGYKYGCFYKQNEKLYAVRNGDSSITEQPFATLQENVWTHLALTRQNNIERWFVNGELIREGENTYNATSQEAFKSATNADFCRTDEYRISDIARQLTPDGKFPVPTKPYSVAEPTGKVEINNAITKTSQLTNDSGFITSVNSKTGNVILTGADIQTTYTYNSEETTTTVNAFANAVFHDINNVVSLIPTKAVTSDNVTKIVKLTQAEYNALETKDDSTFYAIVG